MRAITVAAACLVGPLVLAGSAIAAAPGAIYQRIGPGGALELSNIPAEEGFTLLLAAPPPTVAERVAAVAAAPAAGAAPAGSQILAAELDPNQLIETAPTSAGVPADQAPVAPAATPVANAAPAMAPGLVASTTPSAAAFTARLARYRDFTVSRSTDMAAP